MLGRSMVEQSKWIIDVAWYTLRSTIQRLQYWQQNGLAPCAAGFVQEQSRSSRLLVPMPWCRVG